MSYFAELYLDDKPRLISGRGVYVRAGRSGLTRSIQRHGSSQLVEKSMAVNIYELLRASRTTPSLDVWVVGYDGWLEKVTYAAAAMGFIRDDNSPNFRIIFTQEPVLHRLSLPVDDQKEALHSLGLISKADSTNSEFAASARHAWHQLESYAEAVKRGQRSLTKATVAEILTLAKLPFVHVGDSI